MLLKMEKPEGWMSIEDPMRYDWICLYQDKDGNRYSVWAHIPLEKDELCKLWYIYKVEQIRDWEWPFDYEYKIISWREDKDPNEKS